MESKNKRSDAYDFVRDLAEALQMSFQAVEEESQVLTYKLILPKPRDDYHIAGERGCFEGGATLARIKALGDEKVGITLSILENDPEVIGAAQRLFMEQYYPTITLSYVLGRHTPIGGKVLRRPAA